jgi:protein phosphatase
MNAFGKSDIGKLRDSNEDFIYINNKNIGQLKNLYVVADGMGGCNAGEVASELSVKSFVDYVSRENKYNEENTDILNILANAICHANKVVFEKSQNDLDCSGMGTTFSACCVLNKKLYCLHIGDSRIYLINNSKIKQVSEDHTYVAELLRAGKIKKEQVKNHPKRNIIMRAVGIAEAIEPDTFIINCEPDDYFLICSDGLNTMLDDEKIFEIINLNLNLKEKVLKLIETANDYGGYDNISVILGKVSL